MITYYILKFIAQESGKMNFKQRCNLEEVQFTMKVTNWFRDQLYRKGIASFSMGKSETYFSNKGTTAEPKLSATQTHTLVSFGPFMIHFDSRPVKDD